MRYACLQVGGKLGGRAVAGGADCSLTVRGNRHGHRVNVAARDGGVTHIHAHLQARQLLHLFVELDSYCADAHDRKTFK